MHHEFIRISEEKTNAILFIHGIIGSPHHFKDFIPLVPQSWTVYNILLDGHGADVDAFSHTSMSKWKEQINHVLEGLCAIYSNVFIAAHSMETLFAIEAGLKYPQHIKGLFLLAVPFKVWVCPSAVINAFKVIFNQIDFDDLTALAAKREFSIQPERKLWKYFLWLPRYVELFQEIIQVRKKVYVFNQLQIPCYVFQSDKDELVAKSSADYLKNYPSIKLYFLAYSGHFYYEKQDYRFMLKEFQKFCC